MICFTFKSNPSTLHLFYMLCVINGTEKKTACISVHSPLSPSPAVDGCHMQAPQSADRLRVLLPAVGSASGTPLCRISAPYTKVTRAS